MLLVIQLLGYSIFVDVLIEQTRIDEFHSGVQAPARDVPVHRSP